MGPLNTVNGADQQKGINDYFESVFPLDPNQTNPLNWANDPWIHRPFIWIKWQIGLKMELDRNSIKVIFIIWANVDLFYQFALGCVNIKKKMLWGGKTPTNIFRR